MIRSLLNAGILVRLVGSTDEARRNIGDVPPNLIVLEDDAGGPTTLRRCAVLADHFGEPLVVWCDALTGAEREATSLLGNCEVTPPGLGSDGVATFVINRLAIAAGSAGPSMPPDLLALERSITPMSAFHRTVFQSNRSERSNVESSGEHSQLLLDDRRGRLLVDGTVVSLTKTEREIVRALLSRRDAVWPRQELIDAVWGPKWFGAANLLDTHIRNLRTKLSNAGARTWIATVWGVGYALEERALAHSSR